MRHAREHTRALAPRFTPLPPPFPAQDAAKAGVGPNASSSASPDERPALLSARAVASLLLGQAMALRSKDDITVSVLELGPHLWAQQ